MKRLVLHIGAGKCGSSSIQSYFATHFADARVNMAGETVAYAAVMQNRVLIGRDLSQAQKESPYGYVSSVRMNEVRPDTLQANLAELKEKTPDVDIVLLSCEGWVHEAKSEGAKLFAEIGVPVDLVLVVRPPVELMNASWWQWGVWTGLPLERWCKAQLSLVNFDAMLSSWMALGIGSRVRAIELSQNPIHQLLGFLGFEPADLPEAEVKNAATDARLLRHLIKNKIDYGRSVHQPAIEFRLNETLQLNAEKPPMVFSPALSRHVLQAVFESSKKTLDLVREGGAVSEARVQKYLDVDHYANADHCDFETWVSEHNSDEFVRELIANILRIDASLKDANHKLMAANKPAPVSELDEPVAETRTERSPGLDPGIARIKNGLRSLLSRKST